MKLLLIPDPTSPNGEDAFCREIVRRAADRGHEASTRVIANGPLEATLEALKTGGFASDCDWVIVNSLQPAALLAAKAQNKSVAVRLIDAYADASQGALAEVKRLALKADLLLVPTQHLAEVVKGWGANGQVRRVPYAYDRIMAQQIALVTVRASRPAFQIVSVGRFDELTRPGFETLLSAVARLRLDLHLNLVGDGPALEALKEKARQLCPDRVTFMEPMPHQKLMEFFRAARAYVDPCGLDGFPMLSLYALSEGCPVVGADAGAIRELVRDGENGLLFAPGDAAGLAELIVTLWSVRGLSLKLIAEGIKTVGSHSWDRTVAAVFEALEGAR